MGLLKNRLLYAEESIQVYLVAMKLGGKFNAINDRTLTLRQHYSGRFFNKLRYANNWNFYSQKRKWIRKWILHRFELNNLRRKREGVNVKQFFFSKQNTFCCLVVTKKIHYRNFPVFFMMVISHTLEDLIICRNFVS